MKNILKQIVVFILEKEARMVLKKYKPKIVAITGSVGKTSTKDAIDTALARFYSVRASKKSFNSEIGLPLTILDLPNVEVSTSIIGWMRNILDGLGLIILPNHYPEWLVLEIGADKPGDIKSATEWIKPDVVVVTKLSKVPVHVEFFATPEDLFEEKGNLVKALKPGGTLILNADDEDVLAYRNLSEERVVLFGFGNGADVVARDYRILYNEEKFPCGAGFKVAYENGGEGFEAEHEVSVEGTVGEHHVYHILAACAVCASLGESLEVAVKSFKHHAVTPGRMRLIPGIKGSLIIDDTYNSSPVAVEEGLKTLASFKKQKRKIAVLGDMLELGRYSIDEHKKAGVLAAKAADVLVTVGLRSRYTAEAALDAGMDEANILQFEESKEAGAYIQNMIRAKDIVFVKGSQGVRMERVVEEIMAEPQHKEKFLVRQDKEWQNRG